MKMAIASTYANKVSAWMKVNASPIVALVLSRSKDDVSWIAHPGLDWKVAVAFARTAVLPIHLNKATVALRDFSVEFTQAMLRPASNPKILMERLIKVVPILAHSATRVLVAI